MSQNKYTNPVDCKKVVTKHKGLPNGFLMEMFKDGDKTVVYMTTIHPGGFKGYHLHKVRRSRYVCLKGKVTVSINKAEVTLKAGQSMEIGTNVYIGLKNDGNEAAWLVNYPDPPYDPSLKDEQIDKDEL